MNSLEQIAKELDQEDLLDLPTKKPNEPEEKSTKIEIQHRKKRKKNNRIAKISKKRNR